MPGVEAAARPVLYPTSAFGDSDLRPRLLALKHASESSDPSLKASFMRKLCSRCVDYQSDFPLFALLYDIALARQLSSLVAIAKRQRISPDDAAGDKQNFSGFWQWQREKLEDRSSVWAQARVTVQFRAGPPIPPMKMSCARSGPE